MTVERRGGRFMTQATSVVDRIPDHDRWEPKSRIATREKNYWLSCFTTDGVGVNDYSVIAENSGAYKQRDIRRTWSLHVPNEYIQPQSKQNYQLQLQLFA